GLHRLGSNRKARTESADGREFPTTSAANSEFLAMAVRSGEDQPRAASTHPLRACWPRLGRANRKRRIAFAPESRGSPALHSFGRSHVKHVAGDLRGLVQLPSAQAGCEPAGTCGPIQSN